MDKEWLIKMHQIGGVLGLAYLSIADIKKKELHLSAIVFFGAYGMLCTLFRLKGVYEPSPSFLGSLLLRLVPGLVCLLLGFITREAIGYGDGLVLLGMAAYLSAEQILVAGYVGLLSAGVVSIVALLFFRCSRKYRIPFVPFLFIGYGWTLFVERMS